MAWPTFWLDAHFPPAGPSVRRLNSALSPVPLDFLPVSVALPVSLASFLPWEQSVSCAFSLLPCQLPDSVRSVARSSGLSFGSSISEAVLSLGHSSCFPLMPSSLVAMLSPWCLPRTRFCLGHPGPGSSPRLSTSLLSKVLAGKIRTKGLNGRVKNSGRQKESLLSSAFSSGLWPLWRAAPRHCNVNIHPLIHRTWPSLPRHLCSNITAWLCTLQTVNKPLVATSEGKSKHRIYVNSIPNPLTCIH